MLGRFALGSLIIALTAAVATASGLLLKFNDIGAKIKCPESDCVRIGRDLTDVEIGKPQTVLLVGSDKRKGVQGIGDPGRSDTMILMRIDPEHGGIRLMSLPRDLQVSIPGHGIGKLNEAYTYGGTRLALETIKGLTGIPINHVINADFHGFKGAVDAVGCVYIDVDRRYYHSNYGLPPSLQYAEIDIQPGYQKLCGEQGLDYARYRHGDNDFARSARQQDFVRQARAQIGLSRLISERDDLIKTFTDNTTSDLRRASEMLSIFKLILASSNQPIRQVHWRAVEGPSYVISSPEDIRLNVAEFMSSASSGKPKVKSKKPKLQPPALAGLTWDVLGGRSQAQQAMAQRPGFPVAYPKLRLAPASYVDPPRVYTYRGSDNRDYRGVKFVLELANGFEYYGVMETNWLEPPILADPSESRTVNKKTLDLYYDGKRLRLVAWKTPQAVYWVSNTIQGELTEQQMLQIAGSLTPAPGR